MDGSGTPLVFIRCYKMTRDEDVFTDFGSGKCESSRKIIEKELLCTLFEPK